MSRLSQAPSIYFDSRDDSPTSSVNSFSVESDPAVISAAPPKLERRVSKLAPKANGHSNGRSSEEIEKLKHELTIHLETMIMDLEDDLKNKDDEMRQAWKLEDEKRKEKWRAEDVERQSKWRRQEEEIVLKYMRDDEEREETRLDEMMLKFEAEQNARNEERMKKLTQEQEAKLRHLYIDSKRADARHREDLTMEFTRYMIGWQVLQVIVLGTPISINSLWVLRDTSCLYPWTTARMRIENRTFIVFGGKSSGLGFATAQQLLDAGTYVSIFDEASLTRQLKSSHVITSRVDSSNSQDLQSALEGTGRQAPHFVAYLISVVPQDSVCPGAVLAVNLSSTCYITRMAAKHLIQTAREQDSMNEHGMVISSRGIVAIPANNRSCSSASNAICEIFSGGIFSQAPTGNGGSSRNTFCIVSKSSCETVKTCINSEMGTPLTYGELSLLLDVI
ncbi:hypothetical protein C8J56DRAFT_897468 [Mycena floridula]|nr:hypothetical protein C8J56DRAFT_897468 [Mycena floridula]